MRPNIVLINCDDLGYGDLGCYGSQKNDTPFIDQLAKEGMKFTDFYAASPVCSPSRGALMTGCYPPRIGFDSFNGNAVLFPGDPLGLNPDEETLPSMLKESGYKTMHVGKWHCGDQPEFLPLNHGFDSYYGIPYSNDMGLFEQRKTRPPLPLMLDNEVIQEQPDQGSLTERYVEKSIQFIRENKRNPFFLYFAHMHVHLPLYSSRQFINKSRNGDYGACVMAIDWATQVIVDELKQQGLYDNTIIMFTSDNGSRNDYGESNGVLRGQKGETWEGGLRVPFIAHWNKKIPNETTNEIMTQLDILPTLKSMCKIRTNFRNKIDGMDLSEVLLNREISKRKTFYYYHMDKLQAVRSGEYKLHVARRQNQGNGYEDITVCELYNLQKDMSEIENIAETNPEKVDELMELIQACRLELGDALTQVKGRNRRSPGYVKDSKTLTTYDINHPYIDAFYDRFEFG